MGPIDESVFHEILALAADDAPAMAELLAVFLGQLALRTEAIRGALEEGALEKIAFHTHSLKSSSAALGASGLAEICREFERLAKAGRCPSAPEAERFFRESSLVESWFRRWLKTPTAA